jgi:hypothetical protein
VDQPVTVTSPFQLANCLNLSFKPSFQASVTGKTSNSRGAGLTVKIAYPNAPQGTEANMEQQDEVSQHAWCAVNPRA